MFRRIKTSEKRKKKFAIFCLLKKSVNFHDMDPDPHQIKWILITELIIKNENNLKISAEKKEHIQEELKLRPVRWSI